MPLMGDDGKRLSGAAQAKVKAEKARQLIREGHEAWNAADLAAFAALPRYDFADGSGPYREGLATIQLAMRQASVNPALVPQQRHEAVSRYGAALVKAADPNKIITDLDRRLREALALIEAQRDQLRATRQPPRDSGEAGAALQ